MIPLTAVRNILGYDHVVTINQSRYFWGLASIDSAAAETVPYTEDDIEFARRENEIGRNHWAMIWINGFPFGPMYRAIGTSVQSQPCFIYRTKLDIEVVTKSLQVPTCSGYRLMNMRRIIGEKTLKETMEFFFAHPHLVWCDELTFVEAMFSFFAVTKIRVAELHYHRGPLLLLDGTNMGIGHFDLDGLRISPLVPHDTGNLGVWAYVRPE